MSDDLVNKMSDVNEAYRRLMVWLRDYGPKKSPAFVKDVATVMDAAKEAAEMRQEIERLRAALASLSRAARTAAQTCIDGQNELYRIKHTRPAQRTFRELERWACIMADEAEFAIKVSTGESEVSDE